VLVGHSIGGLYARAYASRYPGEVGGLVLIDSSHPEQYDRYPELLNSGGIEPLVKPLFPWLARIGLFRYYFSAGGEIDFAGLPPRQHAEMVAFWSSPAYFENSGEEYALRPVIYQQAHDLPRQIEAPLAVVSAGRQPTSWKSMIEDATHSSLVFDSHHSQAVAGSVLSLIEVVRLR
jgi:pimeloyl-ACP methyl ester carboxylesterase